MKTKAILVFIIFSILFSAKKGKDVVPETGEIIRFFPQKINKKWVVRERGYVTNHIKQGVWSYFNTEGTLSKKGFFKEVMRFLFIPTLFGAMFYFFSILWISNLSHIEKPEISLVIFNSIYLTIFSAISMVSMILLAVFDSIDHIILFSQLIAYIIFYYFVESIVDLSRIDFEDRISDVQREKRIFTTLTHNIGKELVNAEKMEDIIKLINESAAQTTQANASITWFFDEDENKYKTMAMEGLYPPIYPAKPYILESSTRLINKVQKDKFEVGETYAGKVAKSNEPVYATNLKDTPHPDIQETTNGIIPIQDLICVPIIHEEKSIGVMSVVNRKTKNQQFTESDLSMMETLADQAALAYSQFQLHQESMQKKMGERDVNIAGEIQRGLLPTDFKTSEHMDFHGFSYAAKGVGGDYFDYKKFSDKKYGLIMSDVAGKGVPASLVMVMIRSIFTVSSEEGNPPDRVVDKINKLVASDISEDRYATFLYFIYDADTHVITYSNAANQPLLVYRAEEDDFIELDAEGMPLGITDMAEYELKTSDVKKGDILVLYTDGISEAMDKKRNQYGMDRLKHMIRENKDNSCEVTTKAIYDDIEVFVDGAPQHDDMTLFVSKICS